MTPVLRTSSGGTHVPVVAVPKDGQHVARTRCGQTFTGTVTIGLWSVGCAACRVTR